MSSDDRLPIIFPTKSLISGFVRYCATRGMQCVSSLSRWVIKCRIRFLVAFNSKLAKFLSDDVVSVSPPSDVVLVAAEAFLRFESSSRRLDNRTSMELNIRSSSA